MVHERYQIVKLLAMGGFGAIYLAKDGKKGGQEVVIKDMICADPAEFAIRLTFSRREAEILKVLAVCSLVPRIYDYIEEGQSSLIVMEFIRGKDLLKIMEANNNKSFPLNLVIDWGKCICDLLQVMHTCNPPLIWRDIKPDQILLLEDQRSIKMIDFGTARDIGRTAKERAAAKTKVYTEGYAPPEQIIGRPQLRSDLFALAATLYHLVTGKPPESWYTGEELKKQLQDPHSPLPVKDRWFYELLSINLSEDTYDRSFTAAHFKADLERRQITRQVYCPKCHHVNGARTPHCERCKTPLTPLSIYPCMFCGKLNRLGYRACLSCGNRLREA